MTTMANVIRGYGALQVGPAIAATDLGAGRAELMPLLLALRELTERERGVTELLVAGLGTDEIATRVHISRHTPRDRVKAMFAKVDVSRPRADRRAGHRSRWRPDGPTRARRMTVAGTSYRERGAALK